MPSGRNTCEKFISDLKDIKAKHNQYKKNNPFMQPQYLYNLQIAIWEVDVLIEALEDKLKDWQENGEPQQRETL